MTTFDFSAQLAIGDKGEAFLDNYFSRRYWIIRVPNDLQFCGIDRVYIARVSFKVRLIEYKTDWRAGETGNGFIETVSKAEKGVAGWAYTSRASLIFYFVPPLHHVYIIEPNGLRKVLGEWLSRYPIKPVPNGEWTTEGVIVPLREIERISKVIHIQEAA